MLCETSIGGRVAYLIVQQSYSGDGGIRNYPAAMSMSKVKSSLVSIESLYLGSSGTGSSRVSLSTMWSGVVGPAPRTLPDHPTTRRAAPDDLRPTNGEVIRSPKSTAVRYERGGPGELLHINVKEIWLIPDGGGWRARGRAMGKTSAQTKAKIGLDYIHPSSTTHGRLRHALASHPSTSYFEIVPDETGATKRRVLRALAEPAGIERVDAVIADNAWNHPVSRLTSSI